MDVLNVMLAIMTWLSFAGAISSSVISLFVQGEFKERALMKLFVLMGFGFLSMIGSFLLTRGTFDQVAQKMLADLSFFSIFPLLAIVTLISILLWELKLSLRQKRRDEVLERYYRE